ncbi:DNA mismatch repair protein Msh2 [Planoprotostelium fungivorum]|uniref:DNA mismatch repair protein Msh2 n=1 Tax=Planoprotostelium fungivorum TaxID=1890364 RepID=A0A2P6N058_9EUKA|nr:DNA mismatch repair protein Msh2 [Planoprotostelium fungivorum]
MSHLQVSVDHIAEKGFAEFYRGLERQLYGIHGEEAKMIAAEYFKSMKVVKKWGATRPQKKIKGEDGAGVGSNELEYVTVREKTEVESLLKFLLFDKLLQVEIYEPKKGGVGEYKLDISASPGNYEKIEHLLPTLEQAKDVPPICAVWLTSTPKGSDLMGVAVINTMLREIKVSEFEDNEQMTNFETLLIQSGARECLYSSQNKPTAKLESIISRCNIPLNKRKTNEYKSDNIPQDLNRLLGEDHQQIDKIEMKLAMKATACLIRFLELLSEDIDMVDEKEKKKGKRYKLSSFQFDCYMRLDAAALEALNLFPERGESLKKTTNLFGLLNHCLTPMGSRRLSQWIRQPLKDKEQIENRHDIVSVFTEDTTMRDHLRLNYLKRDVPDIDKLSKKVHAKKASLEDTVKIYYMFKQLPECIEALEKYVSSGPEDKVALIRDTFLLPLKDIDSQSEKYIAMVEQVVDLDAASRNEYIIRADFDEDLKRFGEEKKLYHEKMVRNREAVVDKLGVKESVVALLPKKKIGWYFEVTSKIAREIKLETKPNILIVDAVRKTGVAFQTKELKALNEKYQAAAEQYSAHQQTFVAELQAVLLTYVALMEQASMTLADLDVYTCFAHVSNLNHYIRPQMREPGVKIVLKQSRHPCLDVQEGLDFVPNDVSMTKEASRFVIITGPNMGGKSTYIRQIGMIVLMAQIGCYVPCEDAEISVVDCIMARVGANDSQLRGVSTFMAEMLEMSNILRSATCDSLVIIDELGRGTSTYDGFGLARAISENLCERGCFCLFATHFHELTEMEKETPYVHNLHVEACIVDEELILQHQVNEGPCLQSYGIHVAELANFPKSVIEVAKRKASELERVLKWELTGAADVSEETVKKFMVEFKKIPMDQLSEEEAMKRIAKLKADFGAYGDRPTSTLERYVLKEAVEDIVSHKLSTLFGELQRADHPMSMQWGSCRHDARDMEDTRRLEEGEMSVLKDLTGSDQYWKGNNICNSTDYVGLFCNGAWPVSILLSSYNLNGSIPPSIGTLVNLTILYLDSNSLTGPIPSSIGNLTSLRVLMLASNGLEGPIPFTVGLMTSLLILDLSLNQLNGTIPADIGRMRSLQQLTLSTNHLTGTLPSTIAELKNLTSLTINNNQLNGTIPPFIGQMSGLSILSLMNSSFTGPIPSSFNNLTSITSLGLSYNRISGPIPSFITHLTRLSTLSLDHNELNGSLPSNLDALTQLSTLDVSSNQIGGMLPSAIGNLMDMRYLYLSNNRFEGNVPTSIMNLMYVKSISLSNNSLNGSVPSRDPTLFPLDDLDLSNNLFTSIPYIKVTTDCDMRGNSLPCLPLLDVSSTCDIDYLPRSDAIINAFYGNSTHLSVRQAQSVLNRTSGDVQTVKLISAVTLALSRNVTSFEYTSPSVSIKINSYDTKNSTSQKIENRLTSSNVTVAIPVSIISQPEVALSSISFNPFSSISNQSIYSDVIGVSVYAVGREIDVKGVNELINITMGTIDTIPQDHYAVCQYWNQFSSLWSRDGINLVVDGGSMICQTNHLTNFSIGKEPIVKPPYDPSTRDDTNRIIIIVCCAIGGSIAILTTSILIYLRLSKRKGESAGQLKWIEKTSEEKTQVWRVVQNETTTVAVKKRDVKDVRTLVQEAIRLKAMHHPNVVMYLAHNLNEGWLMIEWMEEGSLFSYARSHPVLPLFYSIGRDVARGMSYVSEQKIVHTQLHPHHVLLRISQGTVLAKITSFSESVEDGTKYKRKPHHHTAPEVIKYGVQYVQSDVWSFGLILLFIASNGRESTEVEMLVHHQQEYDIRTNATIKKNCAKIVAPTWARTRNLSVNSRTRYRLRHKSG